MKAEDAVAKFVARREEEVRLEVRSIHARGLEQRKMLARLAELRREIAALCDKLSFLERW